MPPVIVILVAAISYNVMIWASVHVTIYQAVRNVTSVQRATMAYQLKHVNVSDKIFLLILFSVKESKVPIGSRPYYSGFGTSSNVNYFLKLWSNLPESL